MNEFRSIVTILCSILAVLLVVIVGVRFARSMGTESWRELRAAWMERERTRTWRRTTALLDRLSKPELEVIALQFWTEEFREFQERALRGQRLRNDHATAGPLAENLRIEREENVKTCNVTAREMSRDQLLEVIHTYLKEWSDKGPKSYQRALDLINDPRTTGHSRDCSCST